MGLFRERALRRRVASLVVLGGAMELCGNDAVSRPRGARGASGRGRLGSRGNRCRARREPARGGPLPARMCAYASAVFSQAGIPQDKIQYAAIGTGGCELLATLLSVSLLRPTPSASPCGGPSGVLTLGVQTVGVLTLGVQTVGVLTVGVQTVGVLTAGVQTAGVETLGVLRLRHHRPHSS